MIYRKVLVTLLVLFILLMTGEVVYLLFLSRNAPSDDAIRKAQFIPTTNTKSKEYEQLGATSEAAINPKMLERLKNYIKSPESHLYILSEQTAKVLQIAENGATVEDRRDGKLYPGKILFPLAIRISNKIMPEGYVWLYFHEPVIKKTKVFFRKSGGDITGATIKDIKVGDTITTVETWDPSVDPDMNNLQDTLTKQVVDYTIYIEK